MLGWQDECWWSRLAQPDLHAWTGDPPLRLLELEAPRGDPDRKALCCYGLFRADTAQMLLRFVDGRPVSQVTVDYLTWLAARLAREGKKAIAEPERVLTAAEVEARVCSYYGCEQHEHLRQIPPPKTAREKRKRVAETCTK